MPVRANSFPRELVRPVEGERIQVVECACQLESVKKKVRHSFEAEMVSSS